MERMLPVLQLMMIADDFTGALDTGVQLAKQGVPTRVITDREADLAQAAADCAVLVIDSETRHLSRDEAYGIVYDLTEKAVRLGVPHILKKTDSALRGNVGAELSAVLDASKEPFLPFFPALPEMDRVTVDGVHYIAGVPVAQSPFGKDPFEPVTTSYVPDIIHAQSAQPVRVIRVGEEYDPRALTGIAVFDADSQAALRGAAAGLAAHGAPRVMAGCAGLGGVLKELLSLSGDRRPAPKTAPGMLVLCGSVNPITRAQLSAADECGYAHVHLSPEEKLEEGYFLTAQGGGKIGEWQRMLEKNPYLIIDANDDDPENAPTAAYAARHRLSVDQLRVRISGALGDILSRLMEKESSLPGSLLITGGDTLLACMKRVGVSEMEPLGELSAGVVYSRFEKDGVARFVISKSGGFGSRDLFRELMEQTEQT